ncbi:MAG: hypothetical protein H6721_24330 [Sandaracinus sp.]|nr:hypothetical protein [Sandaracinus sp.]MCB9615936.1 hypothetical protein [Sandaracinus sp.]MCB9622865.1 hypothetical protein [Sandaracinus sp.]MCB9635259.1 hypothetical protein [Sandaracinus sp.]
MARVLAFVDRTAPVLLARLAGLPQMGRALDQVLGGALQTDGSRTVGDVAQTPSLCAHVFLALHLWGALPDVVVLSCPVPATLPSLDARMRVEVHESFVTFGRRGVDGASIERRWVGRVGEAAIDPRGATAVELRHLVDGVTRAIASDPREASGFHRLAREVVASRTAPRWLPLELGRFVVDVRDPPAVAWRVRVEGARHRLAALAELADLGPRPARLVALAERFVARGRLDTAERDELVSLHVEGAARGVRDEMLAARGAPEEVLAPDFRQSGSEPRVALVREVATVTS